MRFIVKHACALLLLSCCKKAFSQHSGSDVIYSTIEGGQAASSPLSTADSTNTEESRTIINIIISGNRQTRPAIILRELPFQIGSQYTLEEITSQFQRAQKHLMNTGLFREVAVTLHASNATEAYISVKVNEKWYIWPKPFLRTVDKNFQQWWTDGNRNMNRLNYGIRVNHNNFTGRNDKLNVAFMNGYTRQLSLQYYGLFLDHQLKWSLNAGFALGKNREINYKTSSNRPVAIKDNDYLRNYFSWFTEVNYRPAIKAKHTLGIGYSYEKIDDTIHKLNPYFAGNSNTIRLPEIYYKLSYFDVDFIPYPTRGFIGEIQLRKKGFGQPLNLLQLTAKGSSTWPVSSNYFFNLSAVGMIKLPLRQPYITNQFIGHDNLYLQGYEYYVVDGVAGGFSKATLTRQVLRTKVRVPFIKWEGGNEVPLKVYLKTFANAGYVYARSTAKNSLNNQLIYSGGVGVDLVLFTDFVVKIDWSFNRLGENGLYLHKRNYF